MIKPRYSNWIFLVILLLLAGFIFLGKLDTTIPTVKLKFVSSDSFKEQQIEYSYAYQGDDMIRGSKFGGYGFSESKTVATGQTIEIPPKRVLSYWPFSHFTYLLINADIQNAQPGGCSWVSSIWGNEYEDLLDKDINDKETIARYPYIVHHSNEFIFRDVKDRVIEVKCL